MSQQISISDWVSIGQAAVIYGLTDDRVLRLVSSWGVPSAQHIGRPVNPSTTGRPVLLYSKVGLEEAMEKDASCRLGGDLPDFFGVPREHDALKLDFDSFRELFRSLDKG